MADYREPGQCSLKDDHVGEGLNGRGAECDSTGGDSSTSSTETMDKYTEKDTVLYRVEDVPPWHITGLLGLQHYLMMVTGTVAVPLLLSRYMCIEHPVSGIADNVAIAEVMGTIFFVSGLITLLQVGVGVRLPIVQGTSFAFITPTISILLNSGPCPTILAQGTNTTEYALSNPNDTTFVLVGSAEHQEVWMSKMRLIQGSMMVASCVQILIGFTGLIGLLMRFLTPLVIAPTVAMIGLSLFRVSSRYASSQWGIALLTLAYIAIFSTYMRNVNIPFFYCSPTKRRCIKGPSWPLFRLFPVIFALILAYIKCVIFTYTDVFPNDPKHDFYRARTDTRISVLVDAPWFRFPYPGQWGIPTVTWAGVCGILAGTVSSVIESIGDYHACARLSGEVKPTVPAMNRGIGIEGFGCLMDGVWGTGTGTSSYSSNVGAVGITRVASRRVIQTAAMFMVIMGLIPKFSAVFVTVPDPILGGMYMAMFGIVTAVGISCLQFVDLNSTRNLFIIGVSLISALTIPEWTDDNRDKINTGSATLDDVIRVLLSTSMFIAGSTAFFLDNTVSGTPKERGLNAWLSTEETSEDDPSKSTKVYDLPWGNDCIHRTKWTRFLPFCPSFRLKSQAKGAQDKVDNNTPSSVKVEGDV